MPGLEYTPAFGVTPYLSKKQYEQNPRTDWNKIFYDHQMTLNSSPYESFDTDLPVPHPSPCSTEFEFDSEPGSFLSFDFEDMINWDNPQLYLPGVESMPTASHANPLLKTEKRASSLPYISLSMDDSMSPQSDEPQDESYEHSSKGNESPKDTLSNSSLDSPSLWEPLEIHLPNDPTTKTKPCEPLSAAEEVRLVAIAMGMQHFPTTTVAPIPLSKSHKKRKASTSSESDTIAVPYNNSKRLKVTKHNAIEKRYREKINDRINALREVIPELRDVVDSDEVSEGDASPPLNASKVNKAVILSKAIEYILSLEKRAKGLSKENEGLKTRIGVYERLLVAPETAARFMKTHASSQYWAE